MTGLKVLQINASYKPAYIYGGPTVSVSRLSEELVKAGCKVSVFTTTANGANELDVALNSSVMIDGVEVTYFKRISKDHSHFSPGLLKAVWKNVKNFEVVHINGWWNTVSVLSCWLAVTRGVPVIISPRGMLSNYTFHNRHHFFKNGIHALLGKSLLKKCGIHVTSEYEEHAINNIINTLYLADLPNFIEMGDYNLVKEKSTNGVLKLLFLSRIEEKKGLDLLIKALAGVTLPYHLTIAGSGDNKYIKELKKIAQQYKVEQNISWIGFQKINKFELMQNQHLLVLPSHDENFGNVVIESLSVGTAVLISNNVGLANYIHNKQIGWICETNAADISSKINSIGRQREVLSLINHEAPQIIHYDFNENVLVKKYIQMYEDYLHFINQGIRYKHVIEKSGKAESHA